MAGANPPRPPHTGLSPGVASSRPGSVSDSCQIAVTNTDFRRLDAVARLACPHAFDHPRPTQTTPRPNLQAGGRRFEPGTLHLSERLWQAVHRRTDCDFDVDRGGYPVLACSGDQAPTAPARERASLSGQPRSRTPTAFSRAHTRGTDRADGSHRSRGDHDLLVPNAHHFLSRARARGRRYELRVKSSPARVTKRSDMRLTCRRDASIHH